MIKRYDIDVMPTGKHFPQYELEVEECEDGMWVKYEDIKHLLERSDNSEYVKCKIETEIKRLEDNPEGDYITRISALEWALRIISERYR